MEDLKYCNFTIQPALKLQNLHNNGSFGWTICYNNYLKSGKIVMVRNYTMEHDYILAMAW